MIRRILLAVVALAMVAAAAAVAVAAAGFAVYAALKAPFGPAGAAAATAGVFALLVAIGALVMGLQARGPKKPAREASMSEKLMQFATDRPIIAAGGALLAGLVALRNPQLAAGLASAFMAGKAAEKDKRRR